MNPGEATQTVETLLNLKREGIITADQVKEALKRLDFYKDIVKAD